MKTSTRVVIAEDEAIIRLDLKELLEEEGYDVVGETGRGDEAVDLVRDLDPDLAILDIKMPGMDGLTAARHIAAERRAAVLILTAFSQRDLIEQARDAGALAQDWPAKVTTRVEAATHLLHSSLVQEGAVTAARALRR